MRFYFSSQLGNRHKISIECNNLSCADALLLQTSKTFMFFGTITEYGWKNRNLDIETNIAINIILYFENMKFILQIYEINVSYNCNYTLRMNEGCLRNDRFGKI